MYIFPNPVTIIKLGIASNTSIVLVTETWFYYYYLCLHIIVVAVSFLHKVIVPTSLVIHMCMDTHKCYVYT